MAHRLLDTCPCSIAQDTQDKMNEYKGVAWALWAHRDISDTFLHL